MKKTIIVLGVACILLAVGIPLAVIGFTTPESTEEEVTRLTYEIEGGFEHQAYGKSPKLKEQPNPKYFNKIIDSILVSYSYRFLPEEPVSRVTGQAEISAVLSSKGMWETEVTLVPRRPTLGNFSTSFPLNPEEFLELAADIGDEIGVRTSPDIILKATIHTEAETSSGVLKDDFIQTCQVDVGGSILEWHRPLILSRKGYWDSLIYEHRGSFSYSIKLKPNILFGETVMYSDTLEASPMVKLTPSSFYPADSTETIDVTLSCQLDSDQPVTQVRNEVEVNAIFSKPEGEEILFELVPKSQLRGSSSVTFPLDIALLYDIIEATEKETEGTIPDYDLLVQANVHTVGRSEFGVIDEVISPNLKLSLESGGLSWPEENQETKSGSFTETVVIPNTYRNKIITSARGVLGVAVVVLLYAVWSYRQANRLKVPIPEVEAEAIRAKRKHKDIIVDVQSFPPTDGQAVIPLDSLDELVKFADALLKPVLHRAETGRHTYCVVDGVIRYQYLHTESEAEEESSA